MADNETGIAEYFAGKNILITGGSGFLGKVLIEKVLRSCPHVNKIYVLIRSKPGLTGQQRLDELTSSILFSKLREMDLSLLNKLVPVEGTLTDEKFGCTQFLYDEMVQKVNIIIHLAASIKFNDPLEEALKTNVVGTKTVIDLACAIPRLQAFVHVSTAYANSSENREIKERHYSPSIKWNKLIELMEKTDKTTFAILTPKILGKARNTYVFTKSLAEDLVWDYRHQLPIIIMRPSIVISCWKEPLPGWTDSLFGASGIMFGVATGVVKVVQTDPDAHAAYVPVDVATKATLAAIWRRARDKDTSPEENIYNVTLEQSLTNHEITHQSMKFLKERPPLQQSLSHISFHQTPSWIVFLILFYMRQLIPALVIDGFLKLGGHQPRLYKLQKRYYKGMQLIGWFLVRSWNFHIHNFLKLDEIILDKDRDVFGPDVNSLLPTQYMKTALDSGCVYLLKEDPSKPSQGWLKANLLYLLDRVILSAEVGFICCIGFLLISKCHFQLLPNQINP